jgi:hypothetical protein
VSTHPTGRGFNSPFLIPAIRLCPDVTVDFERPETDVHIGIQNAWPTFASHRHIANRPPRDGYIVGFLFLGAIAAAALAILHFFMPETSKKHASNHK